MEQVRQLASLEVELEDVGPGMMSQKVVLKSLKKDTSVGNCYHDGLAPMLRCTQKVTSVSVVRVCVCVCVMDKESRKIKNMLIQCPLGCIFDFLIV